MDDFKQSNKYLLAGSIYGFAIAPVFIALGVLLFIAIPYVIINFDYFLSFILTIFVRLIMWISAILAFVVAIASVANSIVSLMAREQNKRKLYKFCVIFSAVALNPISRNGARMGSMTIANQAAL